MIYLIGGPPKCGKTTLAKQLSRKKSIPWLSTDTLQSVIKPYLDPESLPEKFPVSYQRGKSNDEKYVKYSTQEIISAYRGQAKTVFRAMEMFALCELTDGNDYILEGYHLEPEVAHKLLSKHPGKIKSIFLLKTDTKKFIQDIKKSSTPNDWIIQRTQKEETYQKIAEMICAYSQSIEKEAGKHSLESINMDQDFNKKIKTALQTLTRPKVQP
ncbi:MAG: hypothetical protein U5L10_01055 [Candidatus Moranbacteria bacterium]|nr:hypothetical protein [Candidatus Moranbacteria bacterium]